MISRKLRLLPRILGVNFVIFLFACSIFAGITSENDDPNPDSPTPVLLSEPGSTRALVGMKHFIERPNRGKLYNRKVNPDSDSELGLDPTGEIGSDSNLAAVAPDSNIVLFATNIVMLPDEDAGAFRINVQDAQGKQYRFPVLDIQPLKNKPWIYALTVSVKDELGFWENISADGDVLIGVSWRGLTSNRVRLGIGKVGGNIKDDEGATPTPAANFTAAPPALPPVIDNRGQTDNGGFSADGNDQATSKILAPGGLGYPWAGDRVRFLEQATFGPNWEMDMRIKRLGLRIWLNEQFNEPYPSIPYPDIPLMPSSVPADCDSICQRDRYSMYQVQNWFFKEALYGNAQLRHRVAWALSQMWVISGVETQQASHMIAYHKILSQHAFGNYRDLMRDMTLNPGMGDFLDMARSTRNSPNENYAREVLQLFTIGLFMLNQDGTLQRDAQGNAIPTYDQTTVNNFAKVFTGFGFCNTAGASCPNFLTGTVNFKDPLLLNQNNHDVTTKTLLSYPNAPGVNIAANTNGMTELNQALDNIFYHPNVAPFVSRHLIQQMVMSDPSPAYVGRVAAVFNNNGSGVRGDMKSIVRAILLDPEARGNAKTDPNYGKLREPVLFATNLLRSFGATAANGSGQSDGYINPQTTAMAQNAFNAPSVFNYYSPKYVIPGTALNGPEFGIMTTGTSIARANFVNTMVFNRINTSANAPLGTAVNLAEMQTLAAADATGEKLVEALNQKMLHGTMTQQMRGTILTAVQAVAGTSPLDRAKQAIYLIATSSQYQVQR